MIIKLRKLPKELSRPRKESNLLIYSEFQVLICTDERGDVYGSIRIGISSHNPKHGLITDLWINNLGMQGVPLQGCYADLLHEAESVLKKKGVTKVDAYYLDGPGKLEHFYNRGYEPQRRTVEISWDLSKIQKSKIKDQNYNLKVKSGTNDKEEIEELFKNSFQPYWVAPQDFTDKTFFIAYKDDQAVGMIDENLETGVVIRKGFGGERLGSILLNQAFANLKKKGKENASTLATSGLDDYDPQIYLYTMNGGKIVREYINLQKKW